MTYEQDPANPSSGLWKNDEGKPAGYGGSITITEPGDYFVNLYKNDRKEPGSKQPDLNLRLKRKEKQGNTLSSGSRGGAPQRERPQPATSAPADDFVDSDIPFATNRSPF